MVVRSTEKPLDVACCRCAQRTRHVIQDGDGFVPKAAADLLMKAQNDPM
jgi:hypothetical protein